MQIMKTYEKTCNKKHFHLKIAYINAFIVLIRLKILIYLQLEIIY